MTRQKTMRHPGILVTFALLSLFAFGMALAADDTRLNRTTQGLKSVVENGKGRVTENAFDDQAPQGKRSERPAANPKTAATHSKSSSAAARTPNTDFWFYTADIELFSDHDRDGYYYGIDLLFDADTAYAVAEVYAVVYLSQDGGPWEEYAVTEDFNIYGASSNDEYVMVTELVSGYPPGSYDVLIELFDTWDGAFVADIGPADTSELALLPLEDSEWDAPSAGGGSTVVVNHGGGGASGLLLLLVLSGFALRRFRA